MNRINEKRYLSHNLPRRSVRLLPSPYMFIKLRCIRWNSAIVRPDIDIWKIGVFKVFWRLQNIIFSIRVPSSSYHLPQRSLCRSRLATKHHRRRCIQVSHTSHGLLQHFSYFLKINHSICANQTRYNWIFADLLQVVQATCIKLVDKKSWQSTCIKSNLLTT